MLESRARKLGSEDGFALMEVIVSAAVLILVVLGVFAALDAITGTAGANRARTVAATLAEKDQERLRGMDIESVGGPLTPYDVDVAGVKYRVESKAVWVTDASDEQVGCGAQNSQGSYVRLTSTVTSPMTGAAVKPVVLSSIMAPRSKGALIVMVKNAADQPAAGVTVTAPPLQSVATNSAGCAVFSQIEAGNYTVGINRSGFVDWNGNSAPTKLAGVTAGNVTTVEFAYDQAASITVNVQNKLGGVAEPARTVLAANPKPTTGMRTSSSPTVPNPNPYPTDGTIKTGASFLMTNLFPFPEGYTFYSGGCLGADPSKLVPNYFSTYPGTVTLAPGAFGGSVTVYEPPVTFTVVRQDAGSRDNTQIYAYPKAPGCGGVRIPMGTTNTSGKIAYPGLPYGDYDICAFRDASTDRRAVGSVRVDNPAGVTMPDLTIASASRDCGDTLPDSTP